MIFNASLEPTVYTSIHNKNGITLTIRYLCGYRNRRVYIPTKELHLHDPLVPASRRVRPTLTEAEPFVIND